MNIMEKITYNYSAETETKGHMDISQFAKLQKASALKQMYQKTDTIGNNKSLVSYYFRKRIAKLETNCSLLNYFYIKELVLSLNRIIRVADDAEDHEVKTMFTSLLNELGLHTKLFYNEIVPLIHGSDSVVSPEIFQNGKYKKSIQLINAVLKESSQFI